MTATDLRTVTLQCPRCSQEHTLEFRRLARVRNPWEWWALCPVTTEPVLMLDRPLTLWQFLRRYREFFAKIQQA